MGSLRATGSAVITFGMVSAPVKIYTAAETKDKVSFRMLHRECKKPINQISVCKNGCAPEGVDSGLPLDVLDMIKGYPVGDDFVTFEASELEALQEKSTKMIDVKEFVPFTSIGLEMHEKTYYIAPDKGGHRAYALLAAVLKKNKLAGIAQYATRGKDYLVALHAVGNVLYMEQLHYPSAIRDVSLVDIDLPDVSKEEIALGTQLVEGMKAKKFDFGKYEDRVQQRLLAAVEAKIAGTPLDTTEEAPQTRVPDLLTALKNSLATKDA